VRERRGGMESFSDIERKVAVHIFDGIFYIIIIMGLYFPKKMGPSEMV